MPHVIYLAIGFPPAAKSCAYRMRATANLFCELGWDVTVVNLSRDEWLLEYGVDPTLAERVDPRVRVVELPLIRRDLDPDVRHYSWFRARHPDRWRKARHRLDELPFPERAFGPWRARIEEAAEAIHREHPADLCVVSPAPNTMLAAALRLHQRHGVPYVVDFRDAWSLDVLTGQEAFPQRSRRGYWEQRVVSTAQEMWVVNEPIRAHYAARYPELAERLRVVRNGFDPEDMVMAARHVTHAERQLVFGYLGTINLQPVLMRAIVLGWRMARRESGLMENARLVFRGHIGMGMTHGTNYASRVIVNAAREGVEHGGPVPKSEVAAVYGSFDALLLALAGGRYVTSGKVYEYMATGLPILSAHETEHAAAEVLQGYPLWVRARALTPEDIGHAFVQAAELAATTDAEAHAEARRFAARYERRRQLEPAIRAVGDSVAGRARVHA